MDNRIGSFGVGSSTILANPDKTNKSKLMPTPLGTSNGQIQDRLDFGGGEPISQGQAMTVVYDKALEKLRLVVEDARSALGMAQNTIIDTSPEATATRIADFALGAYDGWRSRHSELAEDDARQQFVDFIGGAVNQGFEEARGILSALNVLNGETESNVNKMYELVQKRFQDFLGVSTEA
jgi:hypothetical protein